MGVKEIKIKDVKKIMSIKKLNIVNGNDNIIGIEDRNIIHKKGLLHREVHVYFVTPNNKIIFQHRAKDKDMFPDLLDATVGGHVEINDSYEETAVKEVAEETGVKINQSDLILISKIRNNLKDNATGMINYAFLKEFIYIYKGDINDLKIEKGKALGFEVLTIEKLLNLNEAEKTKFIPYIYKFTTTTLIDFIKNKLIQI